MKKPKAALPDNPYNPHAWIAGNPDIGQDVWIGPFTLIDAVHAKVTIGKGCNISTGAQILSHSTARRCVSGGKHETIETADTKIGAHSFIGSNAVVLMGCVIGHHSVIGAGSVIPENTTIPPYSIVAGVPGKIIGSTLSSSRKRGSASINRKKKRIPDRSRE